MSSSLALNRQGWWHTLTETRLGRKSRFFLSEAAIGNKLEKHPAYKAIHFPSPHSLPFSSGQGTDVPSAMPLRGREEHDTPHIKCKSGRSLRRHEGSSQYKYILRLHYSTKVGQAQDR
jgi:hypothetical protein